jgi:hypothetical protein
MNTDKKQQILETLNKIEAQTKNLNTVLEKIYNTRTLEAEKEFVSSCSYLQMLAKQAISLTGYYKNLSGIPRAYYAPEELEGDVQSVAELVDVELTTINKQIEEGNNANPISVDDITKDEWLETMEKFKDRYKREYTEDTKTYEEGPKAEWMTPPIETNILLDDDIINAAKGFMVGPVGLFRNKAVEAETQKFDSLYEMQIFLLNVQCRTKDMVLYMTFERNGKYFWRGSFVHRQ